MRRDARGRILSTEPAIDRFLRKVRFCAVTGCVLWTGGTTSGRGHSQPYGAFKFEGRRWFAHRWAAKYIHGLDIDGFDVDHCCDPAPNTLCVQHLRAETPARNRELQTMRRMVHLQVGLITYEDVYGPDRSLDVDTLPFYLPPAWLLSAAGQPAIG